MRLVLLDTNAYLRLAKRIRPAVGIQFGQIPYVLTILAAVEDEVHRSPRLKSHFPWFDDAEFANERLAKRMQISASDRKAMEIAKSVLLGYVQMDISNYTSGGRSPPGPTDCWVLAFGEVRKAIVVTDDLGMHQLASDFGIAVWHGYQLLDKLRAAKVVENVLIREIFAALEANGDLTRTWAAAKHTTFKKIFGASF